MLFYRAALPLSRRTLNYTARIIADHRRAIGSAWRLLTPAQQALLVLVHLRKGETFAELAAGFALSTATAWRYVRETTGLLAERTRSLEVALRRAARAGWAYVVLDGTLIAIDRVAADEPFYSGKHKKHGMNVQVVAAPDGRPLWVSGPFPGSVHDLTAARASGALRRLQADGWVVLADEGYVGAGHGVITPFKGRNKPQWKSRSTPSTPDGAALASGPTPS